MTSANPDGNTRGWQRFREEMRDYAVIAAYLWICFSVLLLYKNSLLRAEDMLSLPFSIALVKALVLGKFILIGKAVNVGSHVRPAVLLHRVLWKSVAFLLLLLVFTAIEELVVGLVHEHTVASILAGFTARPWIEIAAPSVVMLLVLIPLISFEEIDQALGAGELRRMLFGKSDGGTQE
jgi:hypothetical protein